MRKGERRLLHTATAAAGGTGLVYGLLKYIRWTDDPFSLVSHPWQPAAQHIHVLVVPLLVFALGVVWRDHLFGHWRRGRREGRRTGMSGVVLAAVMIGSGYALQVATSGQVRTWWAWVHGASSTLFVSIYAIHLVVHRRARRRLTAPPVTAGSVAQNARI
ncbi:MAG: hypothetical protein D6761_03690 [Candidatus Dadabacteria bacterium]|nr:MAG: hypothetical protein D6761_03690 [Candidatus Dadabacteria bacterium]